MARLREVLESKREIDAVLAALGKAGKRRVRRAVKRGEALEDEREAAAAVLLARHVQRFAHEQTFQTGPKWFRLLHRLSIPFGVAAGIWLALQGAWLGYLILVGFALMPLTSLYLRISLRRARRRAAEAERLNS